MAVKSVSRKGYKVEIKLDLDNLSAKDRDSLCRRTDSIFSSEELECKVSTCGMRTYLGKGHTQDYGKFWAAIFQLKTAKDISARLKECTWYNGEERENLITDFIRN